MLVVFASFQYRWCDSKLLVRWLVQLTGRGSAVVLTEVDRVDREMR